MHYVAWTPEVSSASWLEKVFASGLVSVVISNSPMVTHLTRKCVCCLLQHFKFILIRDKLFDLSTVTLGLWSIDYMFLFSRQN